MRTTFGPRVMGRSAAAAAHHHLAAQAAVDVMKAGGNAIDAAVAATLVEGVVDPHMNTLGGEAPMMICDAGSGRITVINGNTVAPRRATADEFRRRELRSIPDEGVLAAGVPAAFSSLVTGLQRFGKLQFREVAAPALDAARQGFPVHRGLIRQEGFGLRDLEIKFVSRWPSSARLYLAGGTVPMEGELLRNPDLADVFQGAIDVERGSQDGREAGLRRVHHFFYRGDVAAAVDRFCRDEDGLLCRADMESYSARLEDPLQVKFGDFTVFKCGYWNQGPAMLQALQILKERRVEALDHNSGPYIHEVVESIKLAYADRNQWYGDPRSVTVPPQLLSDTYARARAALIRNRLILAESGAGNPIEDIALLPKSDLFEPDIPSHGTVHVDIVDREGNMVACTPSGGWIKSSPIVPGLGFALTNRLMTFHLEPDPHPNIVSPGRQPRTTISPSIAHWNGRPRVAFGSMGGDQQDQWQLQFFLNLALFDMNIQEAMEAPKFSSTHFETFFAPHGSIPLGIRAEARISADALDFLSQSGHAVDVVRDWTEGFMVAAGIDLKSGAREAGCDPRGAKSEIFSPAAVCY